MSAHLAAHPCTQQPNLKTNFGTYRSQLRNTQNLDLSGPPPDPYPYCKDYPTYDNHLNHWKGT